MTHATTWERTLDNIRHAAAPIEVSDSGIPAVAVGAPHYELIQLIEALAEGYNRSFSKAEAFRKACHNAISGWRVEE